ncbi:FAD/NAD(P)-binding domain-containing protein [Leucobacter sp. wl10]|uniref:FAD/NAD(P)-binding protein n=1 Tax=Leucobacter sp. wl10 TaxID=2304677 RepID=UPI000E5BC354|nr:FAD/NAD(P)-binding protein [Leucobacter sp. wl10]RGE20773.1 adenylate cyclase [Leucobacter sp. wl10]
MSGSTPPATAPPVRIVCIGAGPAAAMLLERIVANRAQTAPGARLEVRLVDPHPPGGGRIWRRDQSPLLKLNSMLEDVAFFTDPSCRIEGPIEPGPTLAEWVRAVREGRIARPAWSDAALDREIDGIGERDFPTRRLNNAYLSWALEETVLRGGDAVRVEWLEDVAVAVEEGAEGDRPQRVRLASGAGLDADIVVYALGHSGAHPTNESIRLADFADRHGLGYVAPAFTADVDLGWVPSGADVIVRGMGLAAVDLVVLLTEGRGGRFERDGGRDGALRYVPSGREPVLHLGSRRGVPYRSKITSRLSGDPVELEYLGPGFHASLARRSEPLDFERDVRHLIAAEFVTGYYRELFTGHPDRVAAPWERFAPRLRRILNGRHLGEASAELAGLIRAHVPDPDDRFDLDAFDRPLAFADPLTEAEQRSAHTTVHDRVREHIERDLRHRTSQRHSATLGLFMTALHVYLSLAEVPPQLWSARSRTRDLPKRWHACFSYLASGPPGHRLEELIALAEAGAVRFLGGDLDLVADEERGEFAVSGSAVVGSRTARSGASARILIDAWLPEASAARSDNPLLRGLVESGRVRELAVPDGPGDAAPVLTTGLIEAAPDGRIDGPAPQFALGPFVAGPGGGAFTRPGIDSLPFRIHDRCARAILATALAPRPALEAVPG